MAKFHGIVGFVEMQEVRPGVWQEVATEKEYSGDVLKKIDRSVAGEYLNDNLVVNNQISIKTDPFLSQHFSSIKYVRWNNVNWKVKSIDVEPPRLNLTLGEVYNGKQAKSAEDAGRNSRK